MAGLLLYDDRDLAESDTPLDVLDVVATEVANALVAAEKSREDSIELGLLLARQTWHETLVDAVLAPPGVDRLLTDVEIVRDLRNGATLLEQVEDLATKLRRVTPRLVHYLSAFVSDAAVAARIRALGSDPAVSNWVLMRIVPLLCRIDLDAGALSTIGNRAATTDSSLLWGLLIRLLALHRHSATLDLLDGPEGVRDHRAAAAAFIDLGFELPDSMRTPATEATVRALERRAIDDTRGAPLPKVESLL